MKSQNLAPWLVPDMKQWSRKQFHIGGASSDVRCLAIEGGGGGALGETI